MPDLAALQDQIAKLDLAPIKFKLRDGGEYTDTEIDVIETWYRRFLLLASKYPNKAIVVPDPVDDMWHHHILDTRKYAEDCERVFGRLLHHFPYFGLRGEEDGRALREAFDETNQLMQLEFGASAVEELAQLRPEWGNDAAAASCSDCSGYWDRDTSPVPNHDVRPGYFAR
jgi:hypothetical protein